MKRRTVIVTRAELLDDAAFEALVARIRSELSATDAESTEVEFVLADDEK